ncbi:hypothetical protein ACK32A_15765, partial [Aeromonas enteropelogenes]|uniref:hypothetical protein n=1 Tax=Aeromonas enteropelogenes TaxID=29489 RepID=UPI0039892285
IEIEGYICAVMYEDEGSNPSLTAKLSVNQPHEFHGVFSFLEERKGQCHYEVSRSCRATC